MSMFIWILFGVAAGSLAKIVMPGPNAGGLKVAISLGVVGALIGGLAGSALAGELSMHADSRATLMALVGALGVLMSYRSYVMRWEPSHLEARDVSLAK